MFKEYAVKDNGEIVNVSDQLLEYSEEIELVIEKLIEERKITRENAEKCIELGIQSMRNDVFWKKLKGEN